MKGRSSSFSQNTRYSFFVARGRRSACPCIGATGVQKLMEIVSSGSSKKVAGDTRNNWVTLMLVTKNRYHCFNKQSHIDTCTQAFHDLERHEFAFDKLGFAEDHVHLQVNVPKRYSIQSAEIMLKSHSAMKIFEVHPGFRKSYPLGAFWSGYEHHESTGFTNLDQSSAYLRDQQRYHSVIIIDDRQKRLSAE